MSKRITIGLFGLNFNNGNLGCQALAYSFVFMLDKIANYRNVKCYVFLEGKNDKIDFEGTDRVNAEVVAYRFKDLRKIGKLIKSIRMCDYIFDFTAGDSFTDIYGMNRMVRLTIVKMLAIWNTNRLILGPQTYGPFNKYISRLMARYVMEHAYNIVSRDKISAELVQKLTGKTIECLTDIAFTLPYERNLCKYEKFKIGINISGLLWNNGYTGANEFGLTVDYKKYVYEIVSYALSTNAEVWLIPHVFVENSSIEDDVKVSLQVKDKFHEVKIAGTFRTPMEAKSFISGMDIFIGSRMHATIAAISSGVPTIPVSYSRKFEGLFENIEYPYVISATKLNTIEAINRTQDYIVNIAEMQKKLLCSKKIIDEQVIRIYEWLSSIINNEK